MDAICINQIKKGLFGFYLLYYSRAPWSTGKGFLTRLIQHLGLACYSIDGILLDLNPCAWIDRILISGEAHDPFVKEIVIERLRGGGVFIDVGANIGVFTLAAARMPDTVVYAFEPSPRELKRLYRNLVANQTANVVVFPMALGRSSARLTLSLGSNLNPGTNSLVPGMTDEKVVDTVLCHCESFDSLFTRETMGRIKVIKMDVEGFEMEVLQGMTNMLAEAKEVVFLIEVTRSFLLRAGSSAEELYQFFERSGFSAKFGIQSGDRWDEAFSK